MPFKGPHSIGTKKRIARKMKLYAKEHPNWNHVRETVEKMMIRPKLYPSKGLSYVLGVLKGDGYTTHSKYNYHLYVCLGTISKNFASSFKVALEDVGLHPCKVYLDGRNIYHTVAVSKIFVEWYRNLNLTKLKKLVANYQLAFVRGFYESEGSLFFNKAHRRFDVSIANSNLKILKIISKILFSIGIRNTIYKRGRTVNDLQMYNLRIYEDDVQKFLYKTKPCIKFLLNSAVVKDYA